MIPNVDIVDLIALQELSEVVGPTVDDWVYFGKQGDLLGKKIKMSTLASIVSGAIGGVIQRPDRVYQIGVDMPAGSSIDGTATIVTDPYLDGLDYSLHLRGVEYLIKGDEWQNDILGGGFRSTNGQTFDDGAVLTVSFKPEISNVLVTPDAIAKFSNGVRVVNANATLTAADDRKIIYLNSSTNVLTVTLNSVYPENVMCMLIAAEGGQKQTTINAPVGQTLRQDGNRTAIYLNEGETAILIRVGNIWYVHGAEGYRNRLSVKFGGLPFRGALQPGTTYLRAEYPGTWDAIFELSFADPGAVVSGATWLTNPTKWSSGDGSTTFITPDYENTYPRFGGSSNSHGDYLEQQLLSHDHAADNDNANISFVKRNPATKTGNIATNPVGSFEFVQQKTATTGGSENRPNTTIFSKYYFYA